HAFARATDRAAIPDLLSDPMRLAQVVLRAIPNAAIEKHASERAVGGADRLKLIGRLERLQVLLEKSRGELELAQKRAGARKLVGASDAQKQSAQVGGSAARGGRDEGRADLRYGASGLVGPPVEHPGERSHGLERQIERSRRVREQLLSLFDPLERFAGPVAGELDGRDAPQDERAIDRLHETGAKTVDLLEVRQARVEVPEELVHVREPRDALQPLLKLHLGDGLRDLLVIANGRRVIAALAKHVRRARREADETRLVSGEKPVVREDVVEILAGGIDRLNVLREPLVKESAAFLVELPEDRFASVRMEEAHERLVPVRLPLRSLVRRIGGRGRVVPVPALFPALSGTLDVDLFDEVPRDEEVDLRVELASAHAHTLLEHSNRDGPPRRRDPLDRLPLLRRERFDSRSDEMIERARKSDL